MHGQIVEYCSVIGACYSSKRSGRVRVRTICADHQPGLVSIHCVEEFPKRVGIGGLGGVGNPRQKVSIA